MYQNILIPTDLYEENHDLIRKAVEVATTFKGKITLLHVIELSTTALYAASLGFTQFTPPSAEGATLVMRALGTELGIPEEQQAVDVGRVPFKICEYAKSMKVDLILLSHPTHILPKLLGSTTHTLLQHAPCDVWIVRKTMI